jgi:hypothetical protein
LKSSLFEEIRFLDPFAKQIAIEWTGQRKYAKKPVFANNRPFLGRIEPLLRQHPSHCCRRRRWNFPVIKFSVVVLLQPNPSAWDETRSSQIGHKRTKRREIKYNGFNIMFQILLSLLLQMDKHPYILVVKRERDTPGEKGRRNPFNVSVCHTFRIGTTAWKIHTVISHNFDIFFHSVKVRLKICRRNFTLLRYISTEFR